MGRSDPAALSRVPARVRRRRRGARDEAEAPADERPRLRLVVTSGTLGVELDRPFSLGPLLVTELALTLPGIQFPVELSGGVEAFRHRRGVLGRLRLQIGGAGIESFVAPRLRGLLADSTPSLMVAPVEDGFLVGITSSDRALCFEVVVASVDGDLELIVLEARAVGVAAPAQGLALQALHSMLRPVGRLVGAAVRLDDVGAVIAQHVLPLAGMRTPDARAIVWAPPELSLSALSLTGAADVVPPAPSERALSAVQLAGLVQDAELALSRGQLEAARRGYLLGLERAPRHPEISRRLAELDRAVGGRAEAALGVLADTLAPSDAGALGAQLLIQVADQRGAAVALRRAAEQEPYGPLAGLLLAQLARIERTHDVGAEAGADALDTLDRAIARAPSLDVLRWERFTQRLRSGSLAQVREDIEQLEAQARGASERFDVLRRAAMALFEVRMFEEAGDTFERSLRYVPDSVQAVAGLARCLDALGHRRRALQLLERAASLAERKRLPAHRVSIELARALAEIADDRPAAIARVRAVPPTVAEAFEARSLEARWRAEIGDLAGASAALGRLAVEVERALGVLTASPEAAVVVENPIWGEGNDFATQGDARLALARMLSEGAPIEQLDRGDLAAAQRLWALAQRLAPRDAHIARGHRAVLAAIEQASKAASLPSSAVQPEASPQATELPELPQGAAQQAVSAPVEAASAALGEALAQVELDPMVSDGAMDDEIEVERLSEQLRANPADMSVVRALAAALARLGRDLDLLALLSARLEESTGEEKEELAAARAEVLHRLAESARAEGRIDEASLYEGLLEPEQ